MHWEKLLSRKRYQNQVLTSSDEWVRGEYQRDYDRIVFSSAFRRLQNKTQVMPLPESDFVHTRLTHSLETSCVGRSLGRLVGKQILQNYPNLSKTNQVNDSNIGDIVAAACLAHDIGNPPFGHSGEDAISAFFQSNEAQPFITELNDAQKADLQNFEGNASGFRILTHTYPAQCNMPGGLRLTYTTLATFTKYPKESLPKLKGTANTSEKKYGFFQSEKDWFRIIADELGLLPKATDNQVFYHRHPLAFLVEAADDICYRIIDFEDGCRLGLIPPEQGIGLLREILEETSERQSRLTFYDWREQLGYLRARIIDKLINETADIFIQNEAAILTGAYDKPLIGEVSVKAVLDKIKTLSVKEIYRNRPVLEIEAAGFEVLGGLLEVFLKAVFEPSSRRHQKLLDLVPDQYLDVNRTISSNTYDRILRITDFISGLTDQAAISLYRKIKGISLPKVY
ncbi:deoxyguanosinetriphosphate triphosphohydrolase [Adhaeribacter rhizoryzae]|uniref:Deoxyguanosinetriphosphate triphosphohydrolase n=2 Tax=Adhaeribacter rhizoryzae TaxID=2607907 RepID=A0A5M6DBH7_9BACT|nr:deoxyguanosinetriphosphate triphosphohydrolase [Adhaeribacter rhizoryzae]